MAEAKKYPLSLSAAVDNPRIRKETYERYGVPKIDFPRWVLNRNKWRGDETVLDVGSGAGDYYLLLRELYPDVRYFGMDIAPAALALHPAQNELSRADAGSLPYADASFDVVMANHMLFHVADVTATLREFRRVLKPDGLLIAATNSVQTLPELQALLRRAIVLLGVSAKGQMPPPLPHHLFALENGTRQLARHFFAVVRYDLPSTLVFPSIEPVMTFLDSTRDLRESQLPPEISWDDLMLVMREQISVLIGHFGELTVNKISGVLIASDRGGFIEDFVDHENAAP